MILYKFRSLSKLDYFLDIIHNERFYCSPYSNLNDPLEGMFRATIQSGAGNVPYGEKYNDSFHSDEYLTLEKAYEYAKDVKLCSFSAGGAFGDIRMWSHYAEDHKGVVIEVDVPDDDVEKVTYLPELFPMEMIGGADTELDIDRSMHDFILSHKTEHWEHEKEYRRIHKEEYYNIRGKIKAIHLGIRCSDLHMDLLPKIIPEHIHIFTTVLDEDKMAIIKTNNRLNGKEFLCKKRSD